MANDVTLTIGADGSAVGKSLKSLQGTFLKLAATAATVFTGKAIIDAASTQEQAINALNQSLIRTGDYSKEASQDLQDFASELQGVTTIGDETTLELLALAKSFGVTNEEAKQMVTTAADASVALGVDARTALEQLGGTLSGVSGRLAKFVPEVKDLSVEALKSGEAIEVFSEKFAGAARGELATFDGALTQTKNIFGDLLEELGFFITRSPAVINSIKAIGEVLSNAISFLQDNQGAIRQGIGAAVEFLIKGFGFLAQTVMPPVIETFLLLIGVMEQVRKAVLGVIDSFLGFDFVRDSINAVYRLLLAVADVIVDNLLSAFKTLADFAGVEIPSVEKALEGVRKKIEEIADEDAAGGLKDFIKTASQVQDAAINVVKETLRSIQDGAQEIDFDKLGREISEGLKGKLEIAPTANAAETQKSFADLALSFGTKVADTISTNIIPAAQAFGKQFLNIIVKGTQATSQSQELIQKLEVDLQNAQTIEDRQKIEEQITEAQKAQIKAQEEAAESFTSELGGFLADTFLPGAGQFVKLFLELAKDPEAFVAFVEGFVAKLPEIIDAIVEALPRVVEVLAENADKIFIALVVGAVKLIGAAFESIGRVIQVLLTNLGREFENAVRNAGQAFIDSIVEGAQRLIDSLNDFFKKLDPTSGGGTLGKVLSGDFSGAGDDITGALGFADGGISGIVPPGFPNDSFQTQALTSDEMILNKGQQTDLFNFIKNGAQGGGGGQMITVNLVMNEEVLASQILEINRDNLRTA